VATEKAIMNDRIKMLHEYIQDDPSDTFSRYALALEYAKEGETSKAIELLKQLRIIDSDYLALYYQLGKLLQQIGLLDAAVEVFKEGIRVAQKQQNKHTESELRGVLLQLTDDNE
jgi:tetratricopeptide (TPR) repeat protein